MAVEKIVNIKVTETGLDEINQDLISLDKNLDNVSGTGEKAADSVNEVAGNGGAIAILDQLTGGLATRMRDAWEATKLFNTSLKGTRAALIATGIGALVVALGAIVAYWDEIKEAITGANRALVRQIDLLNDQQDILDARLKLNKSEIELAKAQGKNVDDLLLKQKQLNAEKLKSLKTELSILLTQRDQFKESTKGFSLLRALTSERVFGIGLSEKEQEELNDFEKGILDLRSLILDLEKESILLSRGDDPDTTKQEREKVEAVSLIDGITSEEQQEAYLQRQVALAAQRGEETANYLAYQKRLTEIEREEQEERLRQERIIQDQKLALIQTTLFTAANMINESSDAGKAIAIAQALINTYQGITTELATKTATPLEFALKVANIAAVTSIGFKAVKDITSTKIPKMPGGGGGGFGGGGGVSAPSFNVVGTSGQNQIAQALTQEQDPIKAYVVGSEVSTQQSLDRNIVETATIVN